MRKSFCCQDFASKEMYSESRRYDRLESMLQDGSSEPRNLPLQYLRNITDNFSDERLLGAGGFGTVYKGVLSNGETVAVKKLNSSMPGVKDIHFDNEARYLMRLKHPNVVLLVGWCSETENIYVEYNGKYICAEKSERLLCLEYMPNGSLREFLSDEASGLGWDIRYKIIEGICYGLHYLHEEWQYNAPLVHMDLKPANILLDNNMVPKIADFGLSRLFSEAKTWTCTINRDGTLGYMAPEYINRGLISTKSDIFSLGVIILEIVSGHRDYPDETGISSEEFIELVLNNWRNRLQKSKCYTSLETYCKQIRRCTQIGLVCVHRDRSKRPTTRQIIEMLQARTDFRGRKEAHLDSLELDRLDVQGAAAAGEEGIKGILGVGSTWDVLQSSATDENQHTPVSRSGRGFGHQDGVKGEGYDADVVLGFAGTLTSSVSPENDGDTSDTSTESMFHISPSGRFRRKIRSWIRGELLGSGSYGLVYEGITDEGVFLAVKDVRLLDQWSQAKKSIKLEQEIALLSQFKHENIVQYYGTSREDSKLYIFLELVTDGSLRALYHKYRLRDTHVSAYTRQILNGLTYLHERNIVHRNIKCANVLVHADGYLKLADFGLAKEIIKFGVDESVEGCFYWMAPEVANPKKTSGPAADIWSLGCTVLEMLTRQIPYHDLTCVRKHLILICANLSCWLLSLYERACVHNFLNSQYDYSHSTGIFVMQTQALYRIGRGEAPAIPNTLSKDARDFISQCVKPKAEDRPSASDLLEHPFVNRFDEYGIRVGV